jgi:glycosyltransferase involved in cell wall biosynthesis
MQVVTLASPATLPQALALGRSLRRHQPDWPLDVALVAGEEVVSALAGTIPAVAGTDSVRLRSAAQELELELDVERLLARYELDDLSTLLAPRLLRRYAGATSAPVLYMPSSAWVLGDLEPVVDALSRHSVLLVPRAAVDVPDDGLEPSRKQLQRAGRIDETIIAIDGSAAAEDFLAWWERQVEQALGSLDTRHPGFRPEDRPWLARYLELAPARFATAVLDDPGCNLSMWNLHLHTLERDSDVVRVDGSWPLRFLNLPGFDPDRPYQLNVMASRTRVSRAPVLRELCERYADELRAAGWRDSEHRRGVGRRLADGLVFDDALRAMYASALALGEPIEDPFSEEGSRVFLAWLQGPAPQGAARGITRYVFHRVARARPDVTRTYPDLDGADGPAYVAWCWAFGRAELAIPDRFMPPRPDEIQRERPPSRRRGNTGASRRAARAGSRADGPAVRLTGYLGHTLGLGAAARGYVEALGAAGVPVTTVSVPLHHLALPVALADEYGRHGFEDLVHDGHHGFEIVAVNADELPDFVARLGEDYFEGPRIGIWGWETTAIPERWQHAFSLVQEIWVYSRFMAENIGAVAPVPVIALPPPVTRPEQAATPARLGVPEGFLFLFVFDYLSTIQRKNPVGLIEAFKLAFAPGEGPQLLIKTINAPLRPLAEEAVLAAAYGRPDIRLLDRSLTGAELAGVMAACDCYASLHRAEGFGLTLAEAMALGKPVIGTGYSGNVDFMTSENSYLVDYTIGRVGPDCEIYPPEGEWAQPSVEHAAELMRRVWTEPTEAAAKGERAQADVSRLLSPAVTGKNMRDRLEQLSDRSSSKSDFMGLAR